MAKRRFLLNVGQSNASPFADGAGWRTFHYPLDLTQSPTTTLTQGTTREQLLLPDSWPAPFNVPIDLKGRSIPRIRFQNFYVPTVTGYATYPHTGRSASDAGGSANTTSAFYVEQVFHSTAATQAVKLTRASTGEIVTITAVGAGIGTQAGCRVTVTPALSSAPVVGEQFAYEIRASAASSGNTVALTMSFGLKSQHANALQGLRMSTGTGTLDVVSWDNATRTVTLLSAPSVSAGAILTLQPRHGDWDTWSYFLPFSPFEGATGTKTNPYPYGFSYPGFIHAMPGTFYNPTTGSAAYPDSGSYCVGLAVRIAETLGEDIYIVSSELGATPLATSEHLAGSVTTGIGWWDPAQHRNWSPGVPNNCFARTLVELDAAIVAAAAQGDTLECIGIFHVAGEADCGKLEWSENWGNNLRTFRDRMRAEIKARGLWPGDAAKIPYCFSKPSRSLTPALVYVENVHLGTDTVASEDPFMRTWEMDDAELINQSGSFVHYSGAGSFKLEERAYAAIADIWSADADTGAVDICNLALGQIGQKGITSIDPPDGSAAAALCAQWYGRARDSVLAKGQWSFATKRLQLRELDADWPSWEFAYLVPSDMVTPVSVKDPDSTDDYDQSGSLTSTWMLEGPWITLPNSAPFVIEQDASGRRVLLTNQEDAVLRYVRRETDTRRYSDLFQRAVAMQLASDLAGPIVKGAEGAKLMRDCLATLRVLLAEAAEQEGKKQKTVREHVPNWMQF